VGLPRQGGRGGEPERGQGYRKLWQQVTKARARGRGVLRCPPAPSPAPGDCGTARCPSPPLSRPALAALARCTMGRGQACAPCLLTSVASEAGISEARTAGAPPLACGLRTRVSGPIGTVAAGQWRQVLV